MRFGTRTELARKWTARGYRPNGEQRIGYEYGYLSVAINPQTGKLLMLILPDMRVESFQAFVEEFRRFVDGEVTLITDGAAAHRSQRLQLGEQLNVEHLPAYSPELNPVERFFKELRKGLKNQVFNSYEEVEEAVIIVAKPYLKAQEKVKRLTNYHWLQNSPT
jgi:transposase